MFGQHYDPLVVAGFIGWNYCHKSKAIQIPQKIPDLNPQSFRKVFVVKTYVLLIVAHVSDADVKSGGPICVF